MGKTAYYSDQDFEKYLLRSERECKIQFYVWLACSCFIHPVIWYMILTEQSGENDFKPVLAIISVLALFCLAGLRNYYMKTRRIRQNYQKFLADEQAETNTMFDELEAARQKKLNEDTAF